MLLIDADSSLVHWLWSEDKCLQSSCFCGVPSFWLSATCSFPSLQQRALSYTLLMSARLSSAFLGQAPGKVALASMACPLTPKNNHFNNPDRGVGKELALWLSKSILYDRQNSGSGIPKSWVQVSVLIIPSPVLFSKPCNLMSQVNEKQKCPTLCRSSKCQLPSTINSFPGLTANLPLGHFFVSKTADISTKHLFEPAQEEETVEIS